MEVHLPRCSTTTCGGAVEVEVGKEEGHAPTKSAIMSSAIGWSIIQVAHLLMDLALVSTPLTPRDSLAARMCTSVKPISRRGWWIGAALLFSKKKAFQQLYAK